MDFTKPMLSNWIPIASGKKLKEKHSFHPFGITFGIDISLTKVSPGNFIEKKYPWIKSEDEIGAKGYLSYFQISIHAAQKSLLESYDFLRDAKGKGKIRKCGNEGSFVSVR